MEENIEMILPSNRVEGDDSERKREINYEELKKYYLDDPSGKKDFQREMPMPRDYCHYGDGRSMPMNNKDMDDSSIGLLSSILISVLACVSARMLYGDNDYTQAGYIFSIAIIIFSILTVSIKGIVFGLTSLVMIFLVSIIWP